MFFRKTSYKHLFNFFGKQKIYVFGVDVPNLSVKHFNKTILYFFPEKHQLNIYHLLI